MQLGIIGEDDSDIAVLTVLAKRVLGGRNLHVKHFAASGCGRLRKKCTAWAENLETRGCTHVVVAHDLDANNLRELRTLLQGRLRSVRGAASLVLIPVRSIESWLLTDGEALRRVFRLRKIPKLPGQPEALLRPKDFLGDVIWSVGKKPYVNAIHNARIAAEVSLTKIRTCASFIPYPAFLAGVAIEAEQGRSIGRTG